MYISSSRTVEYAKMLLLLQCQCFCSLHIKTIFLRMNAATIRRSDLERNGRRGILLWRSKFSYVLKISVFPFEFTVNIVIQDFGCFGYKIGKTSPLPSNNVIPLGTFSLPTLKWRKFEHEKSSNVGQKMILFSHF